MTPTQNRIVETLRKRGADFTASACIRNWEVGNAYYLDSRNAAHKGLVRMMKTANAEATERRKKGDM